MDLDTGDPQRWQVYQAEDVVPAGRRFRDLAECAEFVSQVVTSARFRSRWTLENPRVEHGRTRMGYSSRGVIRVSRWAYNERTMLHELAHLVMAGEGGYHGTLFVRNYLELVGGFIGPDVRQQLEDSLANRGVGVQESAPEARMRAAELEGILKELRARQAALDRDLDATRARISQNLGLRGSLANRH
jgi:putative metallohydrolase (TIGR04338 family)